MTNRLYKFEIDAPTTANKTKSLPIVPHNDEEKNAFRIHRGWIGFTNKDAEATGDKIGFSISTVEWSEQADIKDIDDEHEVYSWEKTVEKLGTNGNRILYNEPTKFIPLGDDIEGTILKDGKKYYLNSLCTGQDGADVTTQVKLLGQPVDVNDDELADWHDNSLEG